MRSRNGTFLTGDVARQSNPGRSDTATRALQCRLTRRTTDGFSGYGVLLRIQQISGGALLVEQGALYPALHRLESQGLLATEWGTSDNNRRAKFCTLTPPGRRRLREESEGWLRLTAAMAAALSARRKEA